MTVLGTKRMNHQVVPSGGGTLEEITLPEVDAATVVWPRKVALATMKTAALTMQTG